MNTKSLFTDGQRRALFGEITGPAITITCNNGLNGEARSLYLITVWLPASECSGYGTPCLAVRACDSALDIGEAAAKAEAFRRLYTLARRVPLRFDEAALDDFISYRLRRFRGDSARRDSQMARGCDLVRHHRQWCRKVCCYVPRAQDVCDLLKKRSCYSLTRAEIEAADKAREAAVIETRIESYFASVQIGEIS